MSRATTEEENEQFYQESMDSAFPFSYEMDGVAFTVRGLTKREYFAAMAMQNSAETTVRPSIIAIKAVKIADALIEELGKSKDEN